jgi:hypothetical protein
MERGHCGTKMPEPSCPRPLVCNIPSDFVADHPTVTTQHPALV